MLVGRDVDPALVVGLEAVGARALVTLVDHRGRDRGVVERAVDERVDRDAPQPSRRERAVEQALAVVADRDAVGTHRDGLRVLVGRRLLDHRPALDDGPELAPRQRLGRRVLVQPAPRLPGREVHDDDRVRPRVGGVGDERRARVAAAQVEAHVVEVGAGQRDRRVEGDDLDDRVGREVDAHQLRAAGLRRPEQRAARVEHPQPVGGVDDDALHRHERPGVVVARRRVPRLVRVRDGDPVAQLGDRRRDVVAPQRVVDEDPALRRDRDARRHRPLERVHELERRDRLVGRLPGRARAVVALPAHCGSAGRAAHAACPGRSSTLVQPSTRLSNWS